MHKSSTMSACSRILLALTVCSSFFLRAAAQNAPRSRPNVILIMTDDQGYGDLACHGHPFIKTPNLDTLYREGVRLTDYHVSPLCSPTRASLLTGRYCRHVGVTGTGAGEELIGRGIPTMANLFAENGYRTAIFGKWHLGDHYPYRPNDRGFHEVIVHGAGAISTAGDLFGNDYFDDRYYHNGKKVQFKGFCTDVWFDGAKRFITASKAAGKPFFCYVPTNIVHGPYHAPKAFIDMYKGKPGKAAFFAAITHLDKCVGELRTFLQERGLARNTLFIFTTDNGSAAGAAVFDAGMRGRKGSPYDGGHRVPFLVHWPDGGLTGGRDVHQLSAHLDVLPTLVELCGLRTKADFRPNGLSLKPVLDGTRKDLGERVLIESFRGVAMTRQWRLLENKPLPHKKPARKKRKPTPKGKELYDIKQDPGQTKNVAAAHPEVVATLQAELEKVTQGNYSAGHQFIIGSDDQNPTEFTPLQWANMLQLGWWQSGIIEGKGKPGYLLAEVDQAGTYKFSLKRWPTAVGKPICAPATVSVPSNDFGGTEKKQGVALPIRKARLSVGDFDKTIRVTKDMVEAIFKVQLQEGSCKIQAEFLGNQSQKYPVHYLDIERL